MNPIIARRAGAGALAAALAFPAGAAAHGGFDGGHHWRHHHGKYLAGTVSAVDAGANQVTVKLGSTRWHTYRWSNFSGDLKLTVTKVKGADRNGDGQVTLADVAAGDTVIAKVRNLSVADDGTATGTASKLYDRGSTTTALSHDDGDRHEHGDD